MTVTLLVGLVIAGVICTSPHVSPHHSACFGKGRGPRAKDSPADMQKASVRITAYNRSIDLFDILCVFISLPVFLIVNNYITVIQTSESDQVNY